MISPEILEGPQKITWCTGCGNFGILAALKKVVTELDEPLHNYVLTSGIGCSGKIPHYIGGMNSYHTLHGRPIPIATGIHLANTDLKVIVHTGDGDCLAEGLGHFIHAARRNVNISVFIHNNGVNGLTKGQFSPSSPRGYVSKTSPPPPGSPMDPVNPAAQAITAGATFVARGFSGDQKQLVDLMKQAIDHKGFAVLDILQPCVTWNRQLTWKFYNEHTYSLQENGHDITDKSQALEKAMENGDRYPIGVFYQVEKIDLASGLAMPSIGVLKDHTTNLKDVQQIIDDMML
ncbi:MAG: 2-oxoacid:ferredoxin oxidoreductase subunit beta [Candidatus Thorarchaeota archaeon]|nr:2-oxoacid:ferredoxin oxidoreductase subunit beta [Candidatus Thorarchaeota archaeon]